MKKRVVGAMLLGLAVTAAGCTKYGPAAKPSAVKEKSAATSTVEHKVTASSEHKPMTPITPATSTASKATKPKGGV